MTNRILKPGEKPIPREQRIRNSKRRYNRILGILTLIGLGSIAVTILGEANSKQLASYTNKCQARNNVSYLSNTGLVNCFVENSAKLIRDTAAKWDLPPELIAGTILGENEGRHRYQEWKDGFGSAIGLNTTLGICQVSITTAQELDQKFGGYKYSRAKTIERLLDPKTNLDYVARYYIREAEHLGKILSRDSVHDPELMSELGSRFNGGRGYKSDLANLYGPNLVGTLLDDRLLHYFIRDPNERNTVQEKTREFLGANRYNLTRHAALRESMGS